MRQYLQRFRQPWLLPLFAIILFSLIVWFVGPLIAIADVVPLASPTIRMMVIFIILILWGLNNLRVKKQIDNANRVLTEDLQKDTGKASAESTNPDEKMLTRRLQESLTLLKGSRFDREGKLYKLPWYIMIGAPGSGKTTAIQQSGLQFPLQDKIGNEPVKGEGGTRYCDWWFTDDAIFIDTAGRYTTQDNPRNIESGSWLGFLSRLKKARPKRPLNGIIVTISVLDLINKTSTQKNLQINAIKRRIQELNNHLQMRLPVYVTFSKMDTIAGFNSFFCDLEKEERKQLWGLSYDRKHYSEEALREWFDDSFNRLIENLYNRVNHRLHREPSPQKRILAAEFPRQIQSLQGDMEEYVTAIFSSNQFESPMLLRGIFFLSSTQTGSTSQWVNSLAPQEHCIPPIDRTISEPKTYFVADLFKQFIFPEANIASVNDRVKRRFRFAYISLLLASTLGFTGMLYAWSNSKALNETYLKDIESGISTYRNVTHGGLENQHDWDTLAAGLNLIRDLPTGFGDTSDHYQLEMGFGLYQGEKLGQQAQDSYLDALGTYFMEDLDALLIEQITLANDDELLYEALKYYLMLHNPEHMEEQGLRLWVNLLWQRKYPGADQQELRDHLDQHLTTAIGQRLAPTTINQEVVSAARATLIKTPLDMRAYRRIKNDYLDAHRDHFSVAGVLGKKAESLFYRRSGQPLNEGVPVFFTFRGFHSGFNLEKHKLAQQLADEQWIYGDNLQHALTDADIDTIQQQVTDHYFEEYRTRWDTFLSDISLQTFGTINRGRAVVRMLSNTDEPLVKLLSEVRRNTALSDAPTVNEGTREALNNLAEDYAPSTKGRLERLVPSGLLTDATRLPGQEISDYYFELNDYISSDEGSALGNLQNALQGLNTYLQNLSYADDSSLAAFNSTSSQGQFDTLNGLKAAIDDAPPPLQRWFGSLNRSTHDVAIVATKTHMNTAWRSSVLAFYESRLKGKYPLNKNSSQDIKLNDFVEFFAPGGVLDNYFSQYMAPYVEISGNDWHWKKNIGMSAGSLNFFQRAAHIREAYFGNGNQLNVAFSLKPRTLDNVASGISIDTAGSNLNYHHGPLRSASFNWPGDTHTTSKLVFNLASRGAPVSARVDGEWSWFRLLDQYSTAVPSGNNSLLVTFSIDGITSTQELTPLTTRHPFSVGLLAAFEPPARL